MAATDAFEKFMTSISEEDRARLKDFIKKGRAELMGARSEDARVRIVQRTIKEIHELLRAGSEHTPVGKA